MNISLTPELEVIVKDKVASGLYPDASEVVREALRFMHTYEELVYQIKLDNLQAKLAAGEQDLLEGRVVALDAVQLGEYFQGIKKRAINRVNLNKPA